jgi:SAM-dependent methyltransferase
MLHAILHPRHTFRRFQQWRAGFVTDAHGFRRRAYRSYAHYLTEQAEKIEAKGAAWLHDAEITYEQDLRTRLHRSGLPLAGASVLCLGARLGAEVRAFRSFGAFAFGIDLNPGPENPYVAYGDFHRVPLSNGSVSMIFTNALDHVYDFDRVIDEVRRLLAPGGIFIAEIVKGHQAGTPYGFYDAMGWRSVDDVIAAIRAHGFDLQDCQPTDQGKDWTVLRRVP